MIIWEKYNENKLDIDRMECNHFIGIELSKLKRKGNENERINTDTDEDREDW